MALIYDKKCAFYRADYECVAHKWTCFVCEFKIKTIDDLSVKDHLSLVFARNTLKLSLLFSALALLISIMALLFKISK